jgi:hypothetical protein
MFNDIDVGLGEKWIDDLQIEARMDDDVESDEEIMFNAYRACKRDIYETR